jgi:hypothetical protein
VKEVLWSIPRARRDTEEFATFTRKLLCLVALQFIVIIIGAILFVGFSIGISALDFGKLHFSIIAISPVYISFSILEMLQSFIHGPEQQRLSIVKELSTVPDMNDEFEGSPSQLGNDIEMHESDFIDSSMGESDKSKGLFRGK